jgi:hypothetical protein
MAQNDSSQSPPTSIWVTGDSDAQEYWVRTDRDDIRLEGPVSASYVLEAICDQRTADAYGEGFRAGLVAQASSRVAVIGTEAREGGMTDEPEVQGRPSFGREDEICRSVAGAAGGNFRWPDPVNLEGL